jgi:hypothetical protein
MAKCCVFFAVRTELLNIIYASFGFKGWFIGLWSPINHGTKNRCVLLAALPLCIYKILVSNFDPILRIQWFSLRYEEMRNGEIEVPYICLHAFLTWALDGGEWQVSRSDPFIPKKTAPCQNWSVHDGEKKLLCPCRKSNPGVPARNLLSILTELLGFQTLTNNWKSGFYPA